MYGVSLATKGVNISRGVTLASKGIILRTISVSLIPILIEHSTKIKNPPWPISRKIKVVVEIKGQIYSLVKRTQPLLRINLRSIKKVLKNGSYTIFR